MDETQGMKALEYYKLYPLKTYNQNLFNSQTLDHVSQICYENIYNEEKYQMRQMT